MVNSLRTRWWVFILFAMFTAMFLYCSDDSSLQKVADDGGDTSSGETTSPGDNASSDSQTALHIDPINWKLQALQGSSINVIKKDPIPPYPLYAGGSDLYRSTDNGQSWESLPTNFGDNTGIWDIAVHPSNPDILYVIVEGALYRTEDLGNHWTRLDTIITYNSPPAGETYCSTIEIQPDSPPRIFVGTSVQLRLDGFLHTSMDQGEHWEQNSWNWGTPSNLLFDAQTPQKLLVTSKQSGDFVLSDDNGATWHSVDIPRHALSLPGPLFQPSSSIDTLYLGTENLLVDVTAKGMFASYDGGITWQTINNGFSILPTHIIDIEGIAPYLFTLARTPDDRLTTQDGDSPISIQDTRASVYITQRSSVNWMRLSQWFSSSVAINDLAVSGNKTLLLGTGEGIYMLTPEELSAL